MLWTLTLLPTLALAPYLSPGNAERIEALLTPPYSGRNLESLEMEYQRLVQRQVYADMQLLYAPENASRVKVTYAAFHSSDGNPGRDRGFGLHVVKRLTLPLDGGKTKIVYVNEQWPESRENGGLFLPDEIRVQTLAFEGDRRVLGSEKLYLFDSVRLAWGPRQEIKISRRTRYSFDDQTGRNTLKQMRVPVSAPLSCVACHHSPTSFAGEFLAEGETMNHEAIVQDSYFDRPLAETRGFRDYMTYLRERGVPQKFIDDARTALLDPATSLGVPGINSALEHSAHEFDWLGEDGSPSPSENPAVWRTRQGVYQARSGEWLIDATEDIFEGKYRWWFPLVVLPMR